VAELNDALVKALDAGHESVRRYGELRKFKGLENRRRLAHCSV
jgi:hypothetical protein